MRWSRPKRTGGIGPWGTERRSRRRARTFAPADGLEAVLWDSAAPGLGLRARLIGRKTWIVRRRCNGSVVKRTLGALTVKDARHAARAARRSGSETRAGGGPGGADVRADVPRRLRRTIEACDEAGARGRGAPAHPARLRRSARRCRDRKGRAQLVRRSVGRAGGIGEPGPGGAVVDDETCGCARPAKPGLQPVQGSAAAQDGLRGALPDGRRVRCARSGARRRGSRPSGRRRRGALPALHRRAQIRGAAAQVGARTRRPRGVVGLEDRSPHDLAGFARPRRAGGAATTHQLPMGV